MKFILSQCSESEHFNVFVRKAYREQSNSILYLLYCWTWKGRLRWDIYSWFTLVNKRETTIVIVTTTTYFHSLWHEFSIVILLLYLLLSKQKKIVVVLYRSGGGGGLKSWLFIKVGDFGMFILCKLKQFNQISNGDKNLYGREHHVIYLN